MPQPRVSRHLCSLFDVDPEDPEVRRTIQAMIQEPQDTAGIYLEGGHSFDALAAWLRESYPDLAVHHWALADDRCRLVIQYPPTPAPVENGPGAARLEHRLGSLLSQALIALGSHDDEAACNITAKGYINLRGSPLLQEKCNGLLHRFTGTQHHAAAPIMPDAAKEESPVSTPSTASPLFEFQAWKLPPAVRHRLIFSLLELLPVQESLKLINDHDPIPVHYQLLAEQPGQFQYQALEQQGAYFFALITRIREAP